MRQGIDCAAKAAAEAVHGVRNREPRPVFAGFDKANVSQGTTWALPIFWTEAARSDPIASDARHAVTPNG